MDSTWKLELVALPHISRHSSSEYSSSHLPNVLVIILTFLNSCVGEHRSLAHSHIPRMRPSWWFDIVATDDQLPCIRSGELKEFDSIVEDGEDNDYYDIAETVTNTPLKYRMKAGFMSTLWWIRRMRTISIWFTKISILYVYFCMYQGVANIRIFEYIRIFSGTNIHSYHIRIIFSCPEQLNRTHCPSVWPN